MKLEALVLCAVVVVIAAAKPNVVLFLADDLGYGDLSIAGHPTSHTPEIDALAQSGIYFTQFYTASSVCSPSRAAILTGRYPGRSGIWPGVFWPHDIGGLPRSETTLASFLKADGYNTSLIGKWHLGVGVKNEFLPVNHGFQHYLGIPYSHDMCWCRGCFPGKNGTLSPCYDKCNPQFVSCPIYKGTKIVKQPANLTSLTATYTTAATNFIYAQAKSKRPFFLMMSYHQTHHPQFASHLFHNTTIRGTFGDSLTELDWSVGTIMNALKKYKLDKNTIVWFLSDNGPSLVRHQRGGSAGLLRCGKGTTYEGGHRVPGIISWPGKINPKRSTEFFTALDIVPTTLSLLNITYNHSRIDGVDMSPTVLRGEKDVRSFLLFYSPEADKSMGPFAIRYRQYKAHFYTQGSALSDTKNPDRACRPSKPVAHDPPLLFNLESDPAERFDLSGDKETYRDIINLMNTIRKKAATNVVFADSQTNRGQSKLAEPCCSLELHPTMGICKPFPSCCDCVTKL